MPMAFTGVTPGLLLTGNPISLYTVFGLIALTGIAVNAAIVLISAANDRLKAGMSITHATICGSPVHHPDHHHHADDDCGALGACAGPRRQLPDPGPGGHRDCVRAGFLQPADPVCDSAVVPSFRHGPGDIPRYLKFPVQNPPNWTMIEIWTLLHCMPNRDK
jgi:hypothetical protein